MNDPLSYRHLLGVADLPALLLATCLLRLAERMLALAVVLYALQRFASPAFAGWLSFAAMAPGLVMSPLAGAVLDRIGPVRAVAMDMAASAFFVVSLGLVDRLGPAGAAMAVALVVLYSLTGPLSAAGVRTLLPRLVPAAAWDRANALDTAIYALVDVLGPALAGLLVGFIGAEPALVVIGLVYAAAALSMKRIRRAPILPAHPAPLLRQALTGIVLVARQPTLRGLAIAYALYQITWGILVIAVPVVAVRTFTAGMADLVTGLLWAAAGIAGGVGALIAGRLRTAGRERSVMALGMAATTLAAWPIAGQFGLIGLVLGLVLVGAVAGPVDVGLLTLRQRRTDPAQFGRVLSVSISVNSAGLPVGSALAGLLIPWSLSATMLMAAAASALAATAAAALIPASPRAPTE